MKLPRSTHNPPAILKSNSRRSVLTSEASQVFDIRIAPSIRGTISKRSFRAAHLCGRCVANGFRRHGWDRRSGCAVCQRRAAPYSPPNQPNPQLPQLSFGHRRLTSQSASSTVRVFRFQNFFSTLSGSQDGRRLMSEAVRRLSRPEPHYCLWTNGTERWGITNPNIPRALPCRLLLQMMGRIFCRLRRSD